MTFLLLDAIIVLIVLFFVFLSAKKGFVRTLIEVVGFAAAIMIALTISNPLADFVYDKTVKPAIEKTVSTAVNESVNGINEAVDTVWEKLPNFLTESSFTALSKDQLTTTVNDSAASSAESAISTAVSESFLKPAITKILSLLFSVILVIALLLIVKILAKYINKIFTFSVVGDINKTLGGILGLIKGFAIAIVFCLVISLILSFTKDGFLIFTYDNINSSYIFKFLLGFSPFI